METNLRQAYIRTFFYHNKIHFGIAVLAILLSGAIDVMTAYLLQEILDTAIGGDAGRIAKLLWLCLAFLAAIVSSGLLLRWARYAFIRQALRQYKDRAFEDIVKKNISSFSSENTGSYISVLTNDAASIETNYLEATINIVYYIFILLGAIAVMLWYSWSMTLVVIGLSILPILISVLFGNKLALKEKEVSTANELFVSMVKDLLGGFTVIKSFQAEGEARKQYSARNHTLEDIKCVRKRLESLINLISGIAGFALQIGIFIYGAYLAIGGSISAGVVIAFVQLMNFILAPIQRLPPLFANRKAALALIDKMASYAQSNADADGTQTLSDIGEGIEYRDVVFAYEEGKEILKGINVIFEKGKSYAVVGASGSGKTTMLNLLLGSSQNYGGSIQISGKELRNLKKDSLYGMISLIQQNVFVFDNTIIKNISMFKDFDPEQIEDAVRRAGLEPLIREKGEDYLCGENGIHLSGGERQRISIARSLLKKAQVLLMDEATAALDAATASAVTHAILDIKGLTRIIVTHKLEESVLKRFDEIIVIRNGTIAEKGTFCDLLENRQYFYSLYNVAADAA